MRRILLNNQGLSLSTLCMGTVYFGSSTDEKTSFAYLDRFAELGGNFLDTARVYANWLSDAPRHASEKCIGRWLKARGIQDQIIVATKGGHPPLDGSSGPTLHIDELTHQVDDSRRHLNLDVLPLYYLHRDDPTMPITQIMDALFTLQDKGFIRHIACSNWSSDRLLAANEYALRNGREGFVAVSNQWSLARPVPGVGDPTLVYTDDALLEIHRQFQLPLIPFTSTAQGYLSKLASGVPIKKALQDSWGMPENIDIAARAHELAQQKNMSVSQVAQCFFYAQDFPVIPVMAFSSLEQLEEAAAATNMSITAAEASWLLNGR